MLILAYNGLKYLILSKGHGFVAPFMLSYAQRLQIMVDGMMKCVSVERLGLRENAAEINARLPPGLIMPDHQRDLLDDSIRLDLDRAGSTCTACTHHFKADGKDGWAPAPQLYSACAIMFTVR